MQVVSTLILAGLPFDNISIDLYRHQLNTSQSFLSMVYSDKTLEHAGQRGMNPTSVGSMMNSKTAMLGCILIGLLLCSVLMAGCTGNSSGQAEKKVTSENTTTATQASTAVKATSGGSALTVAGSTTVLPVAAKAAESYMAAHPGIDVQVTGGGSGAGVKAAGEGTTMIGMASRDLSADEKTKYP